MHTNLSTIDGDAGRITIREQPLEELARTLDYEGMLGYLWQIPRPDLGPARVKMRGYLPAPATDVDSLRRALAALPPELTPLEAVAAIPMALTAGAPDPTLGHAADFLRLRGVTDPLKVRALDAYLVTVAEHGMNASTYTARVVASTRAGVKASLIAALCALQGPLHGGAPGPVLDLLDELSTVPDRGSFLQGKLAEGERLMGFGHRVYRVRDPRAEILKEAVSTLDSPRLRFAQQVEKEAVAVLARHKPDRRLDTNVEFYTAVLLEALGLERELFTPVFAMGRVGGWLAHVAEQERDGRLIRPV